MIAAARTSVAPLVAEPFVHATWLAANIDTVAIVDTRSVSEYLDGHIAGAVSFPLAHLLVEDTRRSTLLMLAGAAREAFAIRGIGPQTRVVFTDDGDGSAALGVLMAELAGLTGASALHGGVREWMMTGQTVESTPHARERIEIDGSINEQRLVPSIASMEQLYSAGLDGTARLVDARSQLEHEGIVGAQCCNARGHIPGSVHVEWTSFVSGTGDLRPTARIVRDLDSLGIRPEDPIIVYCHDGRRAAFATLSLRAAGFTRVSCSLGSWHEWSANSLPSSTDEH